jgi:hypothetical protein
MIISVLETVLIEDLKKLKSELLLKIGETIDMVDISLNKIKESELQDEYPLH